MIKNKLLKLLQMPSNIFSDISPINFISNEEVWIQDCKGIIDYNEKNIKVNIGKNIIANFKGRNLKIKNLSQSNLLITGFVISLDFIIFYI